MHYAKNSASHTTNDDNSNEKPHREDASRILSDFVFIIISSLSLTCHREQEILYNRLRLDDKNLR